MTTYTVTATATDATTDRITVSSATNMFSGLPIVFSGTVFGGITVGATYYIGTVVPGSPTSTITVTSLPGGAIFALSTAAGTMTGTFSSGGQQIIDIGSVPNDGTGDPLRTAFNDTNVNFDQVFAAGPVGSNVQIANNTIKTINTNGNLVLAPNGTGTVQSNVSILPNTANVRNLGSSAQRWSTIYTQYLDVSANLNIAGNIVYNGDLTVDGNLTVQGNIIQVGNIVTETLTIQLANAASTANAANGAGITVGANDDIATLIYNSTSNVWTTNIGVSSVGNITAPYFFGNGSQLTGLAATYGNANVVTLLAGFGSNTISTTGNITAGYLIGNGSQLTGVTSYANANAVAYGESGWAGNIIPSGNAVYSLGNATNQWNDLYVSNATIFMNNVPVSLSAGNVLTVNGNAVLQNDSNSTITTTGNITANTFFTTANLKIGINPDIVVAGDHSEIKAFGSADSLQIGWEETAPGITDVAYIQFNDYYGGIGFITGNTQTALHGMLLDEVGNLSISGPGFQANIISADNIGLWAGNAVTITSNRLGLANTWTFDTTGNLTAPGNISAVGNVTGAYIKGNGSELTSLPAPVVTQDITSNGAMSIMTYDGNIKYVNYATVEPSSGNIAGGNITTTGLVSATGNITGNYFIGNGSQLTGISSGIQSSIANGTSNVNIATANGNATITANAASTWTFGTDSTLTLPAGSSRITSYGQITIETDNNASGMYLNADGVNLLYANTNVTLRANSIGTNKDWNFGSDGNLAIPGSIIGTATVAIDNRASGNGADIELYSADDITIQARDRTLGSGSEGGDINIYAGDSAEDSDSTGGDIQIYAGDGGAANVDFGGNGGTITIQGGQGGNAIGANFSARSGGDLTLRAGDAGTNNGNIDLGNSGGDVIINAGDSTGNGDPGGTIYLTSGAADASALAGDVVIQAGGTWTFDGAGNLNLPQGGVVYETNIPDGGLNGKTIALKPQGGTNADQELLIYPTVNDANHLHLTTGNLYNTELFLGDDNLYVKLANTGNVVVNSNDDTGNTAQWTFGANGNLTLPGNIIAINYANGNRVTGGVTFNGEAVIGTGTSNTQSGLYLAPDPVSLTNDLYLRVRGNIIDEPTHIHFDTGNNQYFNQFIGDDNKYIQLANTGNIVINTSDYAGNTAQWTFDTTGNLTLPGNTFAVNYANGNAVTFSGGSGNTGNVTFDDQAVVGTGDQVGSSGLYLAPGTESVGNLQYIRVRGGDVATHIHLDTGNNAYFDQYFGSDIKYVKLEAAGNVQIGSNDDTGNSASWTFGVDGNLTVPGDLVIAGNTNVFGTNASLIQTTDDLPLLSLSSGGNGSVSSLWVEDIGNIGTSNIAAVYVNPVPGSGNVRIAVGANGNAGPNLWDFDTTGRLTLPGGSQIRPLGANLDIIAGTGSYVNLITSDESSSVGVDNTGGYITTAGGTWDFGTTGNLTAPGNVSAVGNVTGANFFGNGNTLSNVATTFESTWTVPVGNSTQNFTVSPNNTYYLWVDCNIPNGILTWNATGTVTNTNVPVIGAQYAWVYTGGGTPIDFTSIPNQFVGTANTILRSSVAPSATTNRFDFGINNTSGNAVTVRYGWAQIS